MSKKSILTAKIGIFHLKIQTKLFFFSQKLEVALHNLARMLSKFDEVYHNFRFKKFCALSLSRTS